MKSLKIHSTLIALIFATNIYASEITVELRKSFFPKKDITIDADSPDKIIVNYDINYYISDGCATDIITSYQLGGCPMKSYKTMREEGKYILNIKNSSARRGKGAQTLRLEVRQKKRNSYDIIPVVTVIEGNEDKVTTKDSWFSSPKVTLTSRDEVINDSHLGPKSNPNVRSEATKEQNYSNSK